MDTTTLSVFAAYGLLAGLYLLVIPAIGLIYVDRRWHSSSAWEKVVMFFVVFFFFPGMLLVSPFINVRPQPRSL